MKIKNEFLTLIRCVFGSLTILFSQAKAKQSTQNIFHQVDQKPGPQQRINIPLGQNLTKKQFKVLSGHFLKQGNRKPQHYENDLCVGIIDDEERENSCGVLDFRQFKSQYAIDLVIFDDVMKDQSVMVENKRFNRHSSVFDIRRVNTELNQNDDNGVVQDRVTSKKYRYTRSLILRNKNQGALNIFYFNRLKLIVIQYVV